eukprot:5910964-Alexandrium_andersonii.AAC.1
MSASLVGSEMCIRDSARAAGRAGHAGAVAGIAGRAVGLARAASCEAPAACPQDAPELAGGARG